MKYALGFEDLESEVSHVPLKLISGQVPAWLKGRLLRNGPGKFTLGKERFNHWFDGLAMLHGFYFDNGGVIYSNSLIKSRAYTEGQAQQRICYPSFATVPNYSFFQSIIHWFKAPESGHNTGVSVARLGGDFLALTESAAIIAFDEQSLATNEVIELKNEVSGELTSAHPHYDFDNRYFVNFTVKLGRHSEYRYYRSDNDIRQRRLIGRIPVDRPSYTHSFAMSQRYIIHVDFPLVAHPLRLRFGNVPYIKCYRWKPERGTRFTVLDKASGEIKKQYTTHACFAFHHVNAYEVGDDIVVDMAAKPDASLIDELYLDHLRACQGRPISQPSTLQRFVLPLRASELTLENISEEYLELPTINYRARNAHAYRYAYGIGSYKDRRDDFENQLIKIDAHNGRCAIWYEEGCYPGEPVFAQHPRESGEDSGVLLSVVLDSKQDKSYLLILNAADLQELARLELPHRSPFGFHGQFFPTQ